MHKTKLNQEGRFYVTRLKQPKRGKAKPGKPKLVASWTAVEREVEKFFGPNVAAQATDKTSADGYAYVEFQGIFTLAINDRLFVAREEDVKRVNGGEA